MSDRQHQLNIAVIGCGYWGSKHVRVLCGLPGVAVTLVDRDPGRRQALESAYPIAASVAELDEVIDEIDAAVVATPPLGHHPLSKACLERGVHVLVEKPLTTSVETADDLIDTAESAGLVLMVGHTFEFNPAVWSLAACVRQPEFDRVRYVNSARLNLGLYQPDVDVLWDLAPHDISIINHILDAEPTAVSAWGLELMAEKADVGFLNLYYGDIDVAAKIHVSWLDPMKVRRTTVVGEHQMAVYDDMAEERLRIYDKGVKSGLANGDDSQIPLTYRHGDIVSPFIDFAEPLKLELSHFVESIRSGDHPRVDGRRGREVVRVLCAAQESMRTGRWVDIDCDVIDLREDTGSSEPVASSRPVSDTSPSGANA